MPLARKATPPPEAIKQTNNVMDALNAWTANEDDEEKPQKVKVPLGYTPLAQSDKTAPTTGWRTVFDSESDNFNFAIGMVIIANAIVIGLETDMGRSKFTACEHIFNAIFVFEMLVRIMQIGCEYFMDIRYLFDFTLVTSGSLDLWILPIFVGPGSSKIGYQFSVMRLLRILRLLRVLRVIRLFRMFGHLLLIVKAFGRALQVVLLISVIVVIMIYAFGIVLTQLVGHNSHKWGDRSDDIEMWFGSIPNSMATLFWTMFGCGWTTLLDLLTVVYPTGMVLLVFATYMIITVSLASLIVGLISESLIIAQQEFKQRTLNKFASKKKSVAAEYMEELSALLEDDMDEFGAVEGRDLKQAVKGDSTLISKLAAIGVHLTLDGLMGLVDSVTKSGTQRVNVEHFVEKLTNLSGNSSASALVDVKYDILKNRLKMESIEKKLDQVLEKMK